MIEDNWWLMIIDDWWWLTMIDDDWRWLMMMIIDDWWWWWGFTKWSYFFIYLYAKHVIKLFFFLPKSTVSAQNQTTKGLFKNSLTNKLYAALN